MDRPSAPVISIRTRSENFSQGVWGAPWSMVSIARRSAMQDEPAARSGLATVPDPMIVPEINGRVIAACAISRGKSNTMPSHAFGWPNIDPFTSLISGRSMEPPFQASPNSSGVIATGEKEVQVLL